MTDSGKHVSAEQRSEIDSVLAQLDNTDEKLTVTASDGSVTFSNLNKVFWPETSSSPAIAKRDYARYLTRVSPYLLHHTRDRLFTLIRFPNGIGGMRFYQKHWEQTPPEFASMVRVFTEFDRKDQDFLQCNNLATLLWLCQLAALELHTSHTRNNPSPDGESLPRTYTGNATDLRNSLLNFPDYLVFDIDPYIYSGEEKEGEEPELNKAGFHRGCDLAFWLKDYLDALEIKSFVKTSGKTGIHIYIPMKRDINYDTVRAISGAIGKEILKDHEDDVTMDWAIVKRTGRIFLDHNMNARSKTLASIYSPRTAAEASVSTPLSWAELRNVYPTDFTIHSVPDRTARLGDVWHDILEHKNDLRVLLSGTPADPAKLEVSRPTRQRARKTPG